MKKPFFYDCFPFLNKQNVFYGCILSVFLFAGCADKQVELTDSIYVKGSTDAIIPLNFNWEGTDPNLNWMPQPQGKDPIPTVWTGASNIDLEILKDCKKTDGWELVFNTFTYDINNFTKNPYYVLYNKYRGIMRIFVYVNSVSGCSNSTYIQHGISLETNKYSMLNFAGREITDVSLNQTRFDKVEPKPADGPPFANLKWYMLEYEFAYDPQIVPTLDAHPPQFKISVNSINIDSVSLGGGQEGTLKGTIGSSSSSNIFSTIGNSLGKPLGTGILSVVGGNFFNKHKSIFYDVANLPKYISNNDLGLANDNFSAIAKGVSSALSTATSSLPGAAVSILSGIFGGSSASSEQAVSLNLATKISLKGSISSSFSFTASPFKLYVPGSLKLNDQGTYNVIGDVPLYNMPLGVFNLSNTPVLNRYIIDNYLPMPNSGAHYSMYSKIDENSFHVDWNPEVLKYAAISNVQYEIIISNQTLSSNNSFYPFPIYKEYLNDGSGNWTNLIVYNNTIAGDVQTVLECSNYDECPLIRMSFNVIPNNGAPAVTIVKTFRARYNNIWGPTEFYNNII